MSPSSSTSRHFMAAADELRWLALRAAHVRAHLVPSAVGRLHVLEASGVGPTAEALPPLVLLHGLCSCAVDYGPMIRRLRRNFRRVIAIDLPAHGRSDTPRRGVSIAEMLDAVGAALEQVLDEPAIVFGNSLGGLAALRFALDRPWLTAGLYLASPAGAMGERGELAGLLATLRVSDLASARAFVRRALPSARWAGDLLAWGVRARLGRPELQALIERAESATVPGEALAGLRVPIVLLWGADERLLPASHLAFFRRYLPAHAQIEIAEGFGHVPFFDHPDAVALRVRRFGMRVMAERARAQLASASTIAAA